MWGQDKKILKKCEKSRIIPTRVGTSREAKEILKNGEDHPHACGDKKVWLGIVRCGLGSSPRVWGQAAVRRSDVKLYRIIPTRVGTRIAKGIAELVREDHPHACGDKQAEGSEEPCR